VKKLEASIKKDIGKEQVSSTDSDDYKNPVVDYIDKTEIKQLSKGAEDTSSQSEEDDWDDPSFRMRKKQGLTSSQQRSVKRLLRATLKNKDAKITKDNTEDIIDSKGRIRFDRRQYDLDVYVDILKSVYGMEYDNIRKMSTQPLEIVKKKDDEASEIKYNDEL